MRVMCCKLDPTMTRQQTHLHVQDVLAPVEQLAAASAPADAAARPLQELAGDLGFSAKEVRLGLAKCSACQPLFGSGSAICAQLMHTQCTKSHFRCHGGCAPAGVCCALPALLAAARQTLFAGHQQRVDGCAV